MRYQHAIRNPRAYQQSVERKQRQAHRATELAARHIRQYLERNMKVLYMSTWGALVLELATEQSVTKGISLRLSGAESFLEVINQALVTMISDGSLYLHQEEFEVIIGLPNEWPTFATTPIELTDDVEPEPNWWTRLTNTKCAQPILREIAAAY